MIISDDRIELISDLYEPYSEEITDLFVAEKLSSLYDELLIVSNKINDYN